MAGGAELVNKINSLELENKTLKKGKSLFNDRSNISGCLMGYLTINIVALSIKLSSFFVR